MEGKSEERREIETYLDTIEFFNEGMDDCFFIWDIRTGGIHFSGDIHKKYPLPYHGGEGNTIDEWKRLIYPGDIEKFEDHLSLFISGAEDVYTTQYRLLDKEGNKVWVSCKGKSRFDEEGNPKLMLGRISSSVFSSKVDAVTGLLNADKFMEDMQSCREHKCSGHLLTLGIDNFKNINIKYGRNYGNHILKKVAETLESVTDNSMYVYRLDGDRFAVMLPGGTKEMVEEIYGKVRERLKEYCTVSAGAVFCDSRNSAVDCGTIYQYAEVALDYAKLGGKNILVFFSPDFYKKELDSISLQDEIRKAIQNGFERFYLCYQPLVNSRDFRIWGAEALLRYDSPTRGLVGPSEFVPMLEQTELICPVGEWVLETALKQCREWRKEIPDFHINVNISYVQLRKEGITQRVLELVKEVGLPGEALTLEVTESMQLQDYPYFNRIFSHWKEYGIKIAIDDFGTGYSSLSYLKSIEIDETKIDRCFVTKIQNSAYNYRLLRNVIELAHSASIKVCCEGVETEEELRALKELEPDMLQGYLFARPCMKNEFESLYIMQDSEDYLEREKKEGRFRRLVYQGGGSDKIS